MKEKIGRADLLEMTSEFVNQVDSEENSSGEDFKVNKLTLKKLSKFKI